MKKLISLLAFTLLGLNSLAQTDIFDMNANGGRGNKAYALLGDYFKDISKTYSFIANGKQYIFSYDGEKIERGDSIIQHIYLFRKDVDGWKKACNEPIDTDYRVFHAASRRHESYVYVPNVSYDVVRDSIANGKLICKLFNYRKYLDGTKIYDPNEKYDYIKVYSDGTILTRIFKRYHHEIPINTRGFVDRWVDIKLVPIDGENYKVMKNDKSSTIY